MGIKGIFFDLNGTLSVYGDLTRANRDHEEAIFSYLTNQGMNIPQDIFNGYVKNYFEIEVSKEKSNGMTLFEYKLQELAFKLGVSLNRKELEDLAWVSIHAWEKYHSLDPYAVRLLSNLKMNNFKLALITDFDYPPYIHNFLETNELKPFFNSIVISGNYDIKKPHKDMFNYALRDTRLFADEVVYVGDSIDHDILGASSIGMIPVLIDRNSSTCVAKNSQDNYYIINSLNQLKDIINVLNRNE